MSSEAGEDNWRFPPRQLTPATLVVTEARSVLARQLLAKPFPLQLQREALGIELTGVRHGLTRIS